VPRNRVRNSRGLDVAVLCEFLKIMDVLLDTHALLWWLSDDPALTTEARKIMTDTNNAIFISPASAWEIAIKVRAGKLPTAADLTGDFDGYLSREGFQILKITAQHAIRAGLLPGPHRDPFDRMLIAQSQADNVLIVSNDAAFDSYGIRRVW